MDTAYKISIGDENNLSIASNCTKVLNEPLSVFIEISGNISLEQEFLINIEKLYSTYILSLNY